MANIHDPTKDYELANKLPRFMEAYQEMKKKEEEKKLLEAMEKADLTSKEKESMKSMYEEVEAAGIGAGEVMGQWSDKVDAAMSQPEPLTPWQQEVVNRGEEVQAEARAAGDIMDRQMSMREIGDTVEQPMNFGDEGQTPLDIGDSQPTSFATLTPEQSQQLSNMQFQNKSIQQPAQPQQSQQPQYSIELGQPQIGQPAPTAPQNQMRQAQQAGMQRGRQRMVSQERKGMPPGSYQGMINQFQGQRIPGAKADLDEAFARQEELAAAQRDAQLAQAKQMQADAEAQAALSIEQSREISKTNEAKNNIVSKLMDDYKEVQNETVTQKLEDEGWGKKIGFAIAAALASLGSGLAGGNPLAGMKLIENNLNRRRQKLLDIQKGEREAKKEKLSGIERELQMYREKYGDDVAAMKASHASDWAAVEREMQAQASKYMGTKAEQAYQENLAAVSQRKAEKEMELNQYLEGRVVDVMKLQSDASYRNRMMGLEQQKINIAKQGKGPKQLGEKQTADIADLKAIKSQAEDLKNKFMELTGPGSFIAQFAPGSDASEYNRYADLLRDAFARDRTGAVINESEREDFLGMIPSAATFKSKGVKAFDALINEFSTKINSRLEAFQQAGYDTGGIQPVKSSFR